MATFDDLRRLLGDQAVLLGGQPLRLLLSTPDGSTRVDEVEVGLMLLPGGIPPQLVFSAPTFSEGAPPRPAPAQAPPVQTPPPRRASATGRRQRDTFHHRGLTDAQVKEIIADFRANNGRLQGRCSLFAAKFGVTPTAIRCLYNGKTYLDLTGGPLRSVSDKPEAALVKGTDKRSDARLRGKLTEAQVREIVTHVRAGKHKLGDLSNFAKKFGVDTTTIGHVYHGKSWTKLTGGVLGPPVVQKKAKRA